jgi:hypothetical protein
VQYGYDRDGNVMYTNNLLNSTFSNLYHASGASSGYDNLNQITAYSRGTLSDSNSDGVPDTVANPTSSESWSLTALGNPSNVYVAGTAETSTSNAQNDPNDPPDAAEIDEYSDLLKSGLWSVKSAQGNLCQVAEAPVFCHDGEVSWRTS